MKILLVIDQFFSANNGMTISSRRFAQKLGEHGHEVRIVSTGSQGDTEYLMEKQYIPVFDSLVSAQGMTFAKPDDEILRRAITWADVIHFLVPFALSRHGVNIAREMGKPYTAAFHVQPENITSSIHLGWANLISAGIYRGFHRYFYRYCRHIHCPSRYIAGEMRRHGYRETLHVISNGIDPDFKYRRLPKPAGSDDRFAILTIGRLSIEKRQDILIKAVARSAYRDRIDIMIAGQGPRREKLEKLAKKLKVPVNIRFYNKTDLLDLIATCDLYVHAASAEIEAMSCMEAFACGLVPIIANSPKSATPQFALDERSLFRVNDPEDLAKKIDYWIEHEDERKKMELEYGRLAEKYDLDVCVRQVEDMFLEAIHENETQVKSQAKA